MTPLPAWSPSRYGVALPEGHRFPIAKYALLRAAVEAQGLADVSEPEAASEAVLTRVHDGAYVGGLRDGSLGDAAWRRLGFPWSPSLVARSLRAVGGTCQAARAALERGVAANLAGGTHHAFRDHGEGFCVFNDVAVAASELLSDGSVERVAIVDLDVHQGNGTHAIFADDARVFTFSMHGRRNYPFHKIRGSLDVELEDGAGDDEYLALLAEAMPRVLSQARPDLVFYLAGADPHEGDRLGRLRLTFAGLLRRDHMVFSACREVGLPVCITIAGGYGHDILDTVQVHLNTLRAANDYWG